MRESMFRRSLGLALAAALASVGLAVAPAVAQEVHHHQPGMPTATDVGDAVPLYDNLGDLHHKVTTASPAAQKYFNQGLRLTYAFNHDEAIDSYPAATREDSTCAMCWWGIAYAWAPTSTRRWIPRPQAGLRRDPEGRSFAQGDPRERDMIRRGPALRPRARRQPRPARLGLRQGDGRRWPRSTQTTPRPRRSTPRR